VQRAWEWVKRHRGVLAALAAIWVVLKVGRWLAGGAWAFREWIPWDDVGPWIADHWLLGLLAAGVLFALAFAAVRSAIGLLERRSRRKSVERPEGGPAPPPSGGDLVPGDPLRSG
jgi:hypothetical protein